MTRFKVYLRDSPKTPFRVSLKVPHTSSTYARLSRKASVKASFKEHGCRRYIETSPLFILMISTLIGMIGCRAPGGPDDYQSQEVFVDASMPIESELKEGETWAVSILDRLETEILQTDANSAMVMPRNRRRSRTCIPTKSDSCSSSCSPPILSPLF